MAHTFRDIKVWQKAHELVLGVYKVSKGFPEETKYHLLLAYDLGYLGDTNHTQLS